VVARAAMEMMVVNTTDPMAGNETADHYGQYPAPSGQQLAAVAAAGPLLGSRWARLGRWAIVATRRWGLSRLSALSSTTVR
jgi:hypothetical protein